MLYVLADTNVWLDLAKDVNAQKLIAAVRVLVHEGRLTLLVPQLVLDEFERNRSRVEADMTRSLSANFRRVRDEIEEYSQEKKDAALAELDNLAQRVPLIKEIATRNFDDVHELLAKGTTMDLLCLRGAVRLAPARRPRRYALRVHRHRQRCILWRVHDDLPAHRGPRYRPATS